MPASKPGREIAPTIDEPAIESEATLFPFYLPEGFDYQLTSSSQSSFKR